MVTGRRRCGSTVTSIEISQLPSKMSVLGSVETGSFKKNSCIPGMLIFGTSTVVIQKIIFEMKAFGRHEDWHKFKKP